MSDIKVVIAEDHLLVRKGLRLLLEAEPGIDVIGEAGDGMEAVREAERLQPDVLLMDISMPGINGLEATRRVKSLAPDVQVVVVTMRTNEAIILHMLRAGASAFVTKHSAP